MQTENKTLDWWDTGLEFIIKGQMGRQLVVNAKNELLRQECTRCHKMQPVSEFTKHKYHRYGVDGVCKTCVNKKSTQHYREHSIDYLIKEIKKRSAKKNIPTDLDVEYIEELLKLQEGRCFYTGVKFGEVLTETAMSIDRVDSQKGYTKDNIVLCCIWVNLMKTNYPLGEFLSRVKLLTDNIPRIVTQDPTFVKQIDAPKYGYTNMGYLYAPSKNAKSQKV